MLMSENRRKPDQFQLRLPPGLRDRIKGYADYMGRSMNEEIVRILEREFPEPLVAGARIDELLEMISVLDRSGVTDEKIAKLTLELKETLVGIYSGRVQGLDKESRDQISKQFSEWKEREFEHQQDLAAMEYDPIEEEALSRTGRTEKIVRPDGTVYDPEEERLKRFTPPSDDDEIFGGR